MAGDDVNIRVTATTTQAKRAFKDFKDEATNLKGTLIPLATAAAPLAAALAPIAVKAAGAGLAVGAFGAAVAGQMSNLTDAADAQQKYSDAVLKYGQYSKQAAAAQKLTTDTLKSMPAATARAAVAFQTLRGDFKSWSDSLAGFTMTPVEKSFTLVDQLIPRFTSMAKGASSQLDRLVTVAGGAMASPGFDALANKVSTFANKSLKEAVDGAIHFGRVLSEGGGSGPIKTFMEYANKNGPALRETLRNVGNAVMTLVKASSEAGPGMLSLVNAAAKLVAAMPPSLVATLLQASVALKAVKLASTGFAALAGGVQMFGARLAALRAASVAAGGGMAGLRAAFLSLGTAAKATVVVAGITILAVAMSKLSNIGKKAPPDLDRMATAIGNLARTGKVSGEAMRVFGSDLGGLADSLRTLSRPSNLDKTQQFLTSLIGMDSTPVAEAKENLDSVDKALAGLVKNGKADLAKAAFDDIAKSMQKQGLSSKELRGKLDDYKSALADQALESKLTADSMGLFGQAAQDTSAKLDAQRASADGLRQSLQALNDANRQGLGGMIGFEQAIDDAAQAAKKNAGALHMTHGVLDLNSEKARAAASALQDLADKTDSAAAAARESGSSWETVNGIYSRGRSALIKNAEAMGLSKSQAAALADQILKIPSKNVKVKMNAEDATRDLNSFNAAVRRSPGSRSVTLKTLSSGAERVLESFGLQVRRLPNGKVTVTARTGAALAAIKNVAGAVNSLHSKTIGIGIYQTKYLTTVHRGPSVPGVTPYADGGPITGGSGTRDDVPILAMGGEYMVRKGPAQKHRALLEAINDDRLPKYARGGSVTKAERQARHDAAGLLSLSHFGQMAGYQRSEFGSALARPDSVSSLVNALNQWAGIIKASTHGRQERSLLRALDSSGKKLLSWEKQLGKVEASLSKAKEKLDSLKSAASQLADSVKSNILSSANITKSASGEGPVTVASIMGGLTQSRDKASALAGALKGLKAKGLDKSLIQQIAEAGIEGGGLETAGALLGASSSEIQSINSLQSQIGKSATSAGKTTADAVYAKAIASQEKTVKSLQHSQDKLKASMDKLTKAMEKMIEKAFKGKAAGGIVGAAASGGVRSNLTWVGEQGPELLDLPAGSRVWSHPDSRRMAAAPWASMLNVPRRAPSYGAAHVPAGGHGQPLVIQVQIGDRQFGELWVDTGRREVRAHGGLEATLRPPRGR